MCTCLIALQDIVFIRTWHLNLLLEYFGKLCLLKFNENKWVKIYFPETLGCLNSKYPAWQNSISFGLTATYKAFRIYSHIRQVIN